ncbi:MAG: M48 family metalloprotease [Spirochaetota bacterium]|nr:M48 family metalloprotease [Spirochaetota bacterium]
MFKRAMIFIIIPFLVSVFIFSINNRLDSIDFGGFGNVGKAIDTVKTVQKTVTTIQSFQQEYLTEFTPLEEYYIGRTISAWLLAKRKIYTEPNKKLCKTTIDKYVNQIGRTLSMASDRPETFKGYRFVILDSKSVNAFAVPAGTIFITTALISKADNEDELAGALAHEVAHIELKHPTKAIEKAKKSEAVGKITQYGVKQGTKHANIQELNTVFGNIIKDVQKNVLNGYNANQENEADIRAVDILINTGYSPSGLSSMLRKLTVGGGVHGNPQSRANGVDNKIRSLRANTSIYNKRTKRFMKKTKIVKK